MHDQLPRGRKGGVFRTSPDGLVFDTGDLTFVIPLEDLAIETGGSGGRLTYFRPPSLPGYAFYTSEKALLRDPLFQQSAALSGSAARARGSHHRGRLGFALALAVILALGAGLWFSYDPLVARVARAVPVTWEKALGDKMAPLVTASNRKIDDPAITNQLSRLTLPLVAAAARPDLTFTFTVLENPEPNAFALPGGQVVIYSGLLTKARRAEEVAGVLAHEIAHVTRRHHVRGMLKNAGLVVLVQTLLGDATAVGAVIAEYTTSLSSLSYSRGFEREADSHGWAYLNAAGFDPNGMIEFFQSLLDDQGEAMRKIERGLSLLGTHPSTEERIRTLKGFARSASYSPIDIDYPAFKQLLEKQLQEPAPVDKPDAEGKKED